MGKADLVAIIDGPFLTFRAWNVSGDSDGMFGSSLPLVFSYFKRKADVWIVWEQPGGRGLDFRRKIDPGYKSRRSAKPDDYLAALDELQRVLPWFGVNQAWPKEGEADDAAATLAARDRARGKNVELWALDHDWLQLVAPGVSVRQPSKPPRTVNTANIVELTGGDAAWHLNVMSLAGDTGDDIPGLPRIGKGRAVELLKLCPTIVQDLLDRDAAADVERAIAAKAPNYLRWAQVAIDNAPLLRDTRNLVTLRDVELMEIAGGGDLDRASSWLIEHGLERHLETVRDRLDPEPWEVDDEPVHTAHCEARMKHGDGECECGTDNREPWELEHPASDPPAEPWQ